MNERHLKIKIGKKILNEPIGFSNSILIENRSGKEIKKHELLRFIKSLSLVFEKQGFSELFFKIIINDNGNKAVKFTIENDKLLVDINSGLFDKIGFISQRESIENTVSRLPLKKITKKSKSKSIVAKLNKNKSRVLLFRNILNSAEKEGCDWFSPGTLYLASSLKKENVSFIISSSKISLNEGEFVTNIDELKGILESQPEINLIAITLCEDYFEKVKKLTKFIRERSNAFIALGGPMPTLAPEHTSVHMPDVNFVVRGDGEEILPRLARILDGMNTDSVLNKEKKEQIMDLEGLMFSNNNILISSKSNKINKIKDYDKMFLDFSILKKGDIINGLNLFTSRGCENNCKFCTTVGKGEFVAKSFNNLKDILERYHKRLKEIFRDKQIPEAAFKLSFNDDDFLGDPERAIKFFGYIIKSPFYINFFQTGINSFFIRKNGILTDKLNYRLLDSISEDSFIPKNEKRGKEKTYVYIGTENFSDEELKRLGKGYNYEKAKMIIEELSKRKIVQTHHFILSNTQTNVNNIFENLIKIAKLKLRYDEYFNILYPPVTNLVSLYPSLSYKFILGNNLASCLKKRGDLKIANFPEYDYPLIEKDIPMNENAAVISEKFIQLQKREGNYFKLIDNLLFFLLFRAENMSLKKDKKSKELYDIIEKYHEYPKTILGTDNLVASPFENNKNNIQIMITRKCQLRCKYCPVIKSGEEMEQGTLFRSIEFLMKSKQDNLRLDFTGGEPMLSIQNIKDAVQFAKTLANKRGKNISFYMVTNLINLDHDIAEFLERRDFNLELSIDGNEYSHNLNKIPVDKELNPYKIFTENLKLLKEVDKVAVIVATPQTVHKLFDNFKHITDLGFRKIEINYALGIYWDEKSVNEFFEQFKLIMENFRKEIREGKIMLGNLSKRIEPAILNSEIMVDTDGSIHLLAEWVLNPKVRGETRFSLGNVKDNPNFSNIFSSRFHNYYIIHKAHTSKNERFKKIVINNILLGIKTSKFFRGFSEYGK